MIDMFNNIKKEICDGHVAKSIRAVIVYGSWARGTNDENSDIDIFVVCEFYSDKIANKIKEVILKALHGYDVDISIYDSKKFETLLECGSLYFHHLRDEGVIVYANDKKHSKEYLFRKLHKFKGISEDILLYDRMMKKTAISIKENHSNYFDINMLALLARNTMILICYYMGKPQYGKNEVYETCCELLGDEFLFDKNVYCKLMGYRSYYNRKNISIDLLSEEECIIYINQVEQLIGLAMEKMDIKNSIDRLYYLLNDNPGHNFYTSYEVFTDFDRDLYFSLNKHMKKKYNRVIDSITAPFLEELIQEYKDDDFVKCVYNIILDVKDIKKKSSNYTIDCPDVYTETDMINFKTFGESFDELLKFLCQSKFLRKFLNKYIKEDRKTIMDEMQFLRKCISDELIIDK